MSHAARVGRTLRHPAVTEAWFARRAPVALALYVAAASTVALSGAHLWRLGPIELSAPLAPATLAATAAATAVMLGVTPYGAPVVPRSPRTTSWTVVNALVHSVLGVIATLVATIGAGPAVRAGALTALLVQIACGLAALTIVRTYDLAPAVPVAALLLTLMAFARIGDEAPWNALVGVAGSPTSVVTAACAAGLALGLLALDPRHALALRAPAQYPATQ